MARTFPIADLRTLVARALQAGSYTPAQSRRIRAVPDTRTIRYYTTLGLIDRPAEMQGRTALYNEQHVMQLVAIKRLQAANQTLSDIQSTLVGIPARKLANLADLPAGFWEAADRFLAGRAKSKAATPPANQPRDDGEEFWATPAALPGSPAALPGSPAALPGSPAALPGSPAALPGSPTALPGSPTASPEKPGADRSVPAADHCLRLNLCHGVQLMVDASNAPNDLSRLCAAAAPLIKELNRQGLLSDGYDSSQDPEASP